MSVDTDEVIRAFSQSQIREQEIHKPLIYFNRFM